MAHDGICLKTERLELRGLRPEDAGPIANQLQNWNVLCMLSSPPHPFRLDHAKEFISDRLGKCDTPENCVCAISLADQLVGVISIEPNSNNEPTLGYWLGEAHWGKGMMSEAVATIIGHYFETSHADALYCAAFLENPASIRVQEKAGFTAVGRTEIFSRSRNKVMDSIATKLTRDAFERQRLQ